MGKIRPQFREWKYYMADWFTSINANVTIRENQPQLLKHNWNDRVDTNIQRSVIHRRIFRTSPGN